MAQTSLIQVRVDEDLKREADALFADLGMDTPTAIRIFLKQSLKRSGLPFEVVQPKPNAETLAALLDSMERIPKRYKNFAEIVNEVQAEIEAGDDTGV